MKYTYTVSNNKVICVSHFAKKAVRGIAKCDTSIDQFNEDVGKDLATKRCDVKIAEKRLKRATTKLEEASEILIAAKANMINMIDYYNSAVLELDSARAALEEMENSLK